MTQREHKRLDVPIRIQVLIPSVLCLAVLFGALFWVAVPFVRMQLYSVKSDMIREMTETVWFLMQNYHMRVQSGELTRAESQSRAIERIRSMRYGPNSINYFWIVDLSGMVMLNPSRPHLEGTSGLDLTDNHGRLFIEEMIRIANDLGEGTLNYDWPRPDRPDLPVPKLSYVRIFEPWGWIIGTGVYLDDLHAEIDRVTGHLQIIFLACLAVLAVLSIWLSLLSRRIERHRRDAERKLQTSEQRYRASLENMVCGFVLFELICDESGKPVDARVLQVNQAALRTGNISFDPTGRLIGELFPSVIQERLANIYQVVSTGQSTRYERFYPEFNRWLEVLAFCPQPNHFAMTFTDISERKAAEQALRESEQRRRVLIETTATGYLVLDNQGRVMDANAEYVRLAGYHDLEEIRGRCVLEWTAESEKARNAEGMAQCRRDGYIRNFEVDYVDSQGKITPIEINATVEGTGDTQAILTLCRDITERRAAEQALKASEQQLRLLVENATDTISSHDPDSTIRYVSPSCRALLGYEPEELLGRKAVDFTDPEEAAKNWEVIHSALRAHRPGYQIEQCVPRKDGQYVWIENHARLLYDPAGELTEIQCSIRDITERRKNEEILQALNSRHQAILMAIPDIVAEVDVTHRYTWLNPAGLAFFGDDAVGRYAHDYFIGEQATYQSVQSLFNGGEETIYIESWQRRKDGKKRLLGWWCRPLKDTLGRVIGALSTARDITEAQIAQRQREQLLANLETKNDELQSILYTASHDLRSPLINIQGFGGELENACGKLRELLASSDGGADARRQIDALLTDVVPESLHFVRAGADKIQMLLDGLLRLSRVGSIEITLEPLDMNELLSKVLHAQRFQIQQRSAEVTVDPLPACLGDVVMVNQLFANLIDNALKYSDPSRPCRIRITGQLADAHAVYAVADNGIGIAPEHQQEVFQIFYRLHPGGQVPGEGLGLSIVKRILDRLHGSVRIESSPGQGTTFWITLPAPDGEKQ